MNEADLFAAHGMGRADFPDESLKPGPAPAARPVTVLDRIWTCVRRMPSAPGVIGCLRWTGQRRLDGFGIIALDGAPALVHRIVYVLHHGPTEAPVRQTCGHRWCLEPSHLAVGLAPVPSTPTIRAQEYRARRRAAVASAIPNLSATYPHAVHTGLNGETGLSTGPALHDDDDLSGLKTAETTEEEPFFDEAVS